MQLKKLIQLLVKKLNKLLGDVIQIPLNKIEEDIIEHSLNSIDIWSLFLTIHLVWIITQNIPQKGDLYIS